MKGSEALNKYEWRDDMVLFYGKIMVPDEEASQKEILSHFYDSHMRGHSGMYHTWNLIVSTLYWTGVKADARTYVSQCVTSQRVKFNSQKLSGLLQSLPILNPIWADINMGFIEGLPISNGFNGIIAVVDKLMEYTPFELVYGRSGPSH